MFYKYGAGDAKQRETRETRERRERGEREKETREPIQGVPERSVHLHKQVVKTVEQACLGLTYRTPSINL